MITVEEFTKKVADQFQENIVLEPDIDFRNNDYFDSLIGMSILVMIKDSYNYDMEVSKFLLCNTPRDLFNLIIKDNDSE